MIKTVCLVLGAVLTLVGIIGFFAPHFLGAHLSMPHNIIHLATGLLAIYFGTRTELKAKRFCQIFGVVYGLLGIVGFFMGPGIFTIAEMSGVQDGNLWKLIPGALEFGTSDHVIHVVLGAVFALFGFMPSRVERQVETTAEATRDRVTHR
jgi:hypothetical protein